MARRRDTSGRLFVLLVALALALALTPTRLAGWEGWLADPVTFVVQPIAHPIERLTRWLVPERATVGLDDPRVRELDQRRGEALLALRQAELRITQLQRQVRDLQSGVPVAPGTRVRQVWAPVTSRSSNLADGTIRVGAGRAERVAPGVSVATARGVHLVGRVISVRTHTSWVLPFNHERAGPIEGVVMTGATFAESFGCLLRGRGDGLLAGDMVADAVGVEPGLLVRLRDEAWPAIAQMLVLGRVVEVHRKENGRLRIVVKPELNPERLSEVVIRVPEAAPTSGDRDGSTDDAPKSAASTPEPAG